MRSRLALLGLTLLLAASTGAESEAPPGHLSHHVDGGFRNTNPAFQRPDFWTLWSFLLRQSWRSVVDPRTFDAPRVANDGRAFRDAQAAPTITWIGHSTLLIQIDGVNVLTDPHWGKRASPVSWAGPRRLSPPGLAFEDLPKIDVVLISHDHYDHLDLGTVKRLAVAHDPLFLVPLGLKAWFADNGMTHVAELDWWGTHEQGGVRFVCTPAQHFSQRTPWDRNKRLWSSWAVLGTERRLYFGGDSGYFDGFKAAGDRLGPFDLAAIAIGAYRPAGVMQFTHTTPEQAVAAFADLRARTMLGIHWGTFVLSEEPPDEPPVRMRAETSRRGIDPERAWVFELGETRRW